MDKAALYLRLSKEDVDKLDKGDDSESIVNQRLLLMDYALEHGFLVVGVYSDDDYSGLYDDRPEFDRLIRDAKLGKFNVVIAKTQSRFTRNMEHMEKYLHHDFPLLGIRFIGAVDGVDTQNAANKKSRQINGLVNEWYCEDLSHNIRAVFRQKMKAGQFLGAFAPYGYLKDPADNHKFVVDKNAASVVQKIYALFLEGYSVRGICHQLEDAGILNPTAYKKSIGLNYQNKKADEFGTKYSLWSETTIKRILANEVYTGVLIQGMARKVSYKDKKVISTPRSEWIAVKNHHEPIIDEDTFLQVERLRGSRRICAGNQGTGKKVHVFAGKLRCADCGHTMIKSGGVRGVENDWYMRCQLANKSRLRACTSHNIRYSGIEQAVREKIAELVRLVLEKPDNVLELVQFATACDSRDKIRDKKSGLGNIKKQIAGITKSVQTLYNDRINGIVSEELFFALKENFEDELAQKKRDSERIAHELELLERDACSKKDVRELVCSHADDSVLTHAIVNDFVDYIEIGERDKEKDVQEINIHWNF